LSQHGGHIGYAVAPGSRRRGYATAMTAMFTQALDHCRTLGLTRALITCDDSNIASIRMIERAGGVLDNRIVVPPATTLIRRYWLALDPPGSC
jgi:predicted acetyltransferase